MEFIGHYLLVGAIFAAIDAVWIGVIANKFYKKHMAQLLLDKPKFGPAVLFYLINIAGIVVLALNPALGSDSLLRAIGLGAMLGVVGYATYDLTNASTLKGWPLKVTVVDIVWGTFVTALTTTLAFIVLS
jgi:uncharacterized membrane protein